jgi:signal transduction histidine kinase
VELLLGPALTPGDAAVAVAGTLVLTGSVVLRRRFPLGALVAGAAALTAMSAAHVAGELTPYATLVGGYSLGRYGTRSRAWWGPPVLVAGVVGYYAGSAADDAIEPVTVLVVWLAAWAVGYTMARRREDDERARRAVREQLVAQERTRIAREMHDVVGHTLNVLVVQAGAARLSLESAPDTSRELLLLMERTGRDALAELDDVLGVLREPAAPGEPDLRPAAAGVAHLPELVSRLADSGLRIALDVDPGLELPRNLDLAAYRIVQEALTNALKHAAPCTARVDVHLAGVALVVEVADDGPGCADPCVPGRGLTGIVERAARCGGAVEHGPGERGGFRVHATLPVPAS